MSTRMSPGEECPVCRGRFGRESEDKPCRGCEINRCLFFARFTFWFPTQAEPGTAEKIAIMQTRWEQRVPLWMEGDNDRITTPVVRFRPPARLRIPGGFVSG